MIHRIMLAAALLAVPAIMVAEQPVAASRHAQQADSAKAKKHNKKSMHRKGSKASAPTAAPDSGR